MAERSRPAPAPSKRWRRRRPRCASRVAALYGLAKDHAGPLRPGVDAVESAVKGVVGPVCGLPLDVLAFVDRKVDDTVHEVEVGKHLPGALKAASARAYAVARELAAEAQQSLARQGGAGAEHLAVSVWRSLNGLPVFPHVAQIVVPTAAHWAEKYNRAVATAADHGYAGAKYLPAIPTERIAKVLSSPTEAESQSQ
ncbi:Stress-related protein [Zea mays]|uniref:Stress-related protein n=1 Tax=Zea mays TaxID=4577 RepID=A0A3L6G0C3_MAIZE|nr:Stress-related protein [Zea mays]